MADISKIRLGNQGGTYTEYDIKDAEARQAAAGIEQDIILGGVYDVSAKNSGATFASLSALLSDANLSTLIPTAVRKGGMSIRFVTTSDNSYVQYRYMGTGITGTPNPFLDTTNWQGVDDEPTAGSENLVKSGGVENVTTKIVIDTHNENIKKQDRFSSETTILKDDSDEFVISDCNGHVLFKANAEGVDYVGKYVPESEIIPGTKISDTNSFNIIDRYGKIGFSVNNNGVDFADKTKTILNDLAKGEVITPALGTYGQPNAVYKIPATGRCRIAFDFTINDNLNVSGTDKSFLHLVGKNLEKDVKTTHAVPQDLYLPYNKYNDGESPTAIAQSIGYRSGFDIFGKTIIRSLGKITVGSTVYQPRKPLVGNTAFAMWLHGDFTKSDYPSATDISDRSTLLSSMQNATISFTNDVLTVSGVSTNDISVNAKANGEYKSIRDFYSDLVSALGEYFAFKKLDITADGDAGDLLQFGTVKLVSYYWQQLNPTSAGCGYLYDSFPILIPLAVDKTLHTAEIINDNGVVWVSIDGDFNKYNDTLEEVYIGGTSLESGLVTCKNLEVDINHFGDSLVDDNRGIISDRTNQIIGIALHKIEDKAEGETLEGSSNWSVSRFMDVISIIKEKGYTLIGENELSKWLGGNYRLPKRCAFFLATSNPFGNYVNSDYARELITSTGYRFILGSIIKTELDSVFSGNVDDMFKDVVSAKNSGFDFITHAYTHNSSADPGLLDYKGSLILQQELYKLIDLCKESGISSRIYSYGPSCQSANFFNMLSYMGFVGAISISGGVTSTKATSPYMLTRVNPCDSLAINIVKSYFI